MHMSPNTSGTNTPLRGVLTESLDAVRERQLSAFTNLLAGCENRCVIFGCGGLGRRAISKLTELGAPPVALCDNNEALWGTKIETIPVFSVAEAAARFGADALFLIAVWNPQHWYGETAQQLRAAGVRSITSFLPLFWRYPKDFLPVLLLNDLPENVYASREDVFAAEEYWADEVSLDIYRANIQWRALGNAELMPTRPYTNTYFSEELIRRVSNESLVDCGAYDGDTLREFLACYDSNFAAVYPIEGDSVSFDKLSRYVGSLPSSLSSKIHPIHCALGATRGVVRFSADGVTGSNIEHADTAGLDVPCYPLDELPIPEQVTMIKMDIEGAEYDALLGARRMIQRDSPVLAICVYHTQSDIWRIPLLVRSMLPEHKLYLRSYEGDGFQTVMYAVPPDRVPI